MLTDKYLWFLTQNFDEYSDVLTNIKTIENENIGSYCKIFKTKENKNIIYVWLKGTDILEKGKNGKLKLNLKDLLADMFFFKKILNDKMKVHAGFWSAAESIYFDIMRHLNDIIIRGNQEIVIFGHSLGAAMAKEIARRLSDLFLNKIKIITFGTPRTGNKHYAKHFDFFNIKEYIHRADIVCKLPLRIMNYRHVSRKNIKYIGTWGISIKAHLNYGKYL